MPDLWQNILNPDIPLAYIDPSKLKGMRRVGCNRCPLDEEEGIVKILGFERIRQRSAMLWGQCPGKDENDQELEWVGRAGALLWKELKRVGLSRKDVDVQNVVRCRPTNDEGRDRDPSKEEIEHCRYHTDQALALNAGHAGTHLVFGKIAAKALLGAEYKGDRPCFWSEKLAAMVFCLDHPSYFLRGAPRWRLDEFRTRLKAAAWFVKNPGRFSFIDSLDLQPLTRPGAVRKFLAKAKASGERAAVDIEEGTIEGETKVLCISISYKKRSARSIILDHPENPRTPEEIAEVWDLVREFLQDASVKKCFQFGSYDVDRLKQLEGIRVKGYDFDTTYAHYLRYTFLQSHGLETIAALHYPLYAGYKDLLKPYTDRDGNYATVPLKVLAKYNCADAALTKEIELDLRDQISLPLLRIYVWAGLTLRRMENRGPKLDRKYWEEVNYLVPKRLKRLTGELRRLADNPDLNPHTPAQLAKVIYDDLGLPEQEEGGRSTAEEILTLIIQETDHPFPKALLEWRGLSKMETTYLRNYKVSADMHDGELRTKWFLTGAVTGRLRSGGSKQGYKGVVNMQNLHGSPFLQNLLVSDPDWRAILEAAQALAALRKGGVDITKKGAGIPELSEELLDLEVFLAFDYSQIEIRMLAECSGDETLIQQFREGKDIHCAVGTTLNPAWSFEFIKKDKETRTFIKNCHFGMVYGLDAKGLYYYLKAKGIKTTEKKVAKFHRAYFKKYRKVAAYIESQREFAAENKYVDTMFGFRRLVGNEADESRTTNPENQAVNSPIQGSAHTLLLSAMAMLSLYPKRYHLLQAPLMEVHDALVFRVKLRHLRAAYDMAKALLEKDVPDFIEDLYGIRLQVPLLSEGSAGFRYGTMVEIDGGNRRKFLADWAEKNSAVEEKVTTEYRKAA